MERYRNSPQEVPNSPLAWRPDPNALYGKSLLVLHHIANVLKRDIVASKPVPLFDNAQHRLATPNTSTEILVISGPVPSVTEPSIKYTKMKVSVMNFIELAGCTTLHDLPLTIQVWVPVAMLIAAGVMMSPIPQAVHILPSHQSSSFMCHHDYLSETANQ